jgi:hypothetical protein
MAPWQTQHRRRVEHGGMRVDQAKRLKDVEAANALVATGTSSSTWRPSRSRLRGAHSAPSGLKLRRKRTTAVTVTMIAAWEMVA